MRIGTESGFHKKALAGLQRQCLPPPDDWIAAIIAPKDDNADRLRHAFTHLHTASGRAHWGTATRHRAPNKPLLLLTVIDLFAQGLITANLIEPSDDLIDLFGLYWALVMLLDRQGNLAV